MENEKDIAPINEDLNEEIYKVEQIQQKIYFIRGKQKISYHFLMEEILAEELT